MGALPFASAMIVMLVGFFISAPFVLFLFGVLSFFVMLFTFKYLFFFIKEWIFKDQRPPIAGLMLNLLIHFNRLFDYQTSLAKKHRTFRLIAPSYSEIFTADPANIEHILKTNFSNYNKGDYNSDIMRDLFGDGIFAVDGDKWRHQRKLASYEFSTKVLRDFSSAVFRANAAKLTSKIHVAVAAKQTFDMQVSH